MTSTCMDGMGVWEIFISNIMFAYSFSGVLRYRYNSEDKILFTQYEFGGIGKI